MSDWLLTVDKKTNTCRPYSSEPKGLIVCPVKKGNSVHRPDIHYLPCEPNAERPGKAKNIVRTSRRLLYLRFIEASIHLFWFSERYRKSFPSASSSFASSSFREDSTDTDSSLRSPKMLHVDHFDALEPHHQFRKSISTGMRLALKEPEEGDWPRRIASKFDF